MSVVNLHEVCVCLYMCNVYTCVYIYNDVKKQQQHHQQQLLEQQELENSRAVNVDVMRCQ